MGRARYQNDGRPPTSGPGFAVTAHADALEAARETLPASREN